MTIKLSFLIAKENKSDKLIIVGELWKIKKDLRL